MLPARIPLRSVRHQGSHIWLMDKQPSLTMRLASQFDRIRQEEHVAYRHFLMALLNSGVYDGRRRYNAKSTTQGLRVVCSRVKGRTRSCRKSKQQPSKKGDCFRGQLSRSNTPLTSRVTVAPGSTDCVSSFVAEWQAHCDRHMCPAKAMMSSPLDRYVIGYV